MALVRTIVLEELIASVIRVTRIGALGTTLAVTNNRSTLRRSSWLGLPVTANVVSNSTIVVILMTEAIRSSETMVLTGASQCHIQEDGIHNISRV
jgi:hypothetical protein